MDFDSAAFSFKEAKRAEQHLNEDLAALDDVRVLLEYPRAKVRFSRLNFADQLKAGCISWAVRSVDGSSLDQLLGGLVFSALGPEARDAYEVRLAFHDAKLRVKEIATKTATDVNTDDFTTNQLERMIDRTLASRGINSLTSTRSPEEVLVALVANDRRMLAETQKKVLLHLRDLGQLAGLDQQTDYRLESCLVSGENVTEVYQDVITYLNDSTARYSPLIPGDDGPALIIYAAPSTSGDREL